MPDDPKIIEVLELVLGVDCADHAVREALRKDLEFVRKCRVSCENALDAILAGILRIAVYSFVGAGAYMVGSVVLDPSSIRKISTIVIPPGH